MLINRTTMTQLKQVIDASDIFRLKQSATAANALDRKHKKEMDQRFQEIEKKIASAMEKGRPLPKDFTFEDIITNQAFETAKKAFILAATQEPKKTKVTKLAKRKARPKAHSFPKGQMPRTLSGLMDLWDKWKKKDVKTPSRQKKLADGLKKAYIKKTQEMYKRYSKLYREGSDADKKRIIERIKDNGRTTFSRAKTIVETETTKYYNQARRDYYDQSDDVTHYLFVPIRDMATTKWCKSRRMLVYTKGSKYLEDETPPIHWNCRSELLPLSPLNPKHKKLIDDLSKRRENNKPQPLPKEWAA